MTETRRADAVAEERRKRSGAAPDPSLARFNLTPDKLDHRNFEYRSVADRGNRLASLTKDDDYDFVTTAGGKASDASEAGVIRYRSGTVDGLPEYTYLLRKPKKFADEDRAARLAKLDAEERVALSEDNAEAPDVRYTPGRNSTPKR